MGHGADPSESAKPHSTSMQEIPISSPAPSGPEAALAETHLQCFKPTACGRNAAEGLLDPQLPPCFQSLYAFKIQISNSDPYIIQ